MRARTRKKLIEMLDRLGDEFPEWRLGQLVENVAGWADRPTWDVEDDQLLQAASQYLKGNASKRRPLAKASKRS